MTQLLNEKTEAAIQRFEKAVEREMVRNDLGSESVKEAETAEALNALRARIASISLTPEEARLLYEASRHGHMINDDNPCPVCVAQRKLRKIANKNE